MKANPAGVPLKQWGIYRKVLSIINAGTCGELCSLRWTWLTPEGNRELVYTGVLAHLLAASRQLAGGELQRLHLEPVAAAPACFALAAFAGGVVAEMEIHEALPSTVPSARFLVADFTAGRVTNRPLVGHHHTEGAFLATVEGAQSLLFEPMPVVTEALEDAALQAMISQALKEGCK